MRFKPILALGLFAVALFGAVVVACSSAPTCKPGTLQLLIELDGAAAYADSIRITGKDVGATVSMTIPHDQNGPNTVSVDVSFAEGYPAGKTVTLLVEALSGGQLLGGSQAIIHLDDNCSTGGVSLGGYIPPDLGSVD
jgi:hypothetical protein